MSLGVVDGDESLLFLGDEGDHGVFELFSVLVEDDMVISEIDESESVEAEVSVVDEAFMVGS